MAAGPSVARHGGRRDGSGQGLRPLQPDGRNDHERTWRTRSDRRWWPVPWKSPANRRLVRSTTIHAGSPKSDGATRCEDKPRYRFSRETELRCGANNEDLFQIPRAAWAPS
ncbi:hypothetical protein KM043_005952 [Ampulex compressa]|nr:hypothetical protein KM043_005952 [Ampulex compressa]